jgi:hypothetical protein
MDIADADDLVDLLYTITVALDVAAENVEAVAERYGLFTHGIAFRCPNGLVAWVGPPREEDGR